MTEAIIYRSGNGLVKGFAISGHAIEKTGFMGSVAGAVKSMIKGRNAKPVKKGEYDLICAAISAIGFTAVGALGEICGVHDYLEQDGNLEMTLPGDLSPELLAKAGVILQTMEIGLKQVEAQYPEHLHVLNKEV